MTEHDAEEYDKYANEPYLVLPYCVGALPKSLLERVATPGETGREWPPPPRRMIHIIQIRPVSAPEVQVHCFIPVIHMISAPVPAIRVNLAVGESVVIMIATRASY